MILFLLIVRPPPRSNRTAPLVPSPTLVRSLVTDAAAQPLLPRLVPRSSRLPSDDRDRSVHLRHRCACHRLVTVVRRPARRRCGSHVKAPTPSDCSDYLSHAETGGRPRAAGSSFNSSWIRELGRARGGERGFQYM